ncbi:MAG: hypothetical protein Q3962_04365 [Corynebacterium sp.]|nr:hypothetical protein [Corynebacterium sp.]
MEQLHLSQLSACDAARTVLEDFLAEQYPKAKLFYIPGTEYHYLEVDSKLYQLFYGMAETIQELAASRLDLSPNNDPHVNLDELNGFVVFGFVQSTADRGKPIGPTSAYVACIEKEYINQCQESGHTLIYPPFEMAMTADRIEDYFLEQLRPVADHMLQTERHSIMAAGRTVELYTLPGSDFSAIPEWGTSYAQSGKTWSFHWGPTIEITIGATIDIRLYGTTNLHDILGLYRFLFPAVITNVLRIDGKLITLGYESQGQGSFTGCLAMLTEAHDALVSAGLNPALFRIRDLSKFVQYRDSAQRLLDYMGFEGYYPDAYLSTVVPASPQTVDVYSVSREEHPIQFLAMTTEEERPQRLNMNLGDENIREKLAVEWPNYLTNPTVRHTILHAIETLSLNAFANSPCQFPPEGDLVIDLPRTLAQLAKASVSYPHFSATISQMLINLWWQLPFHDSYSWVIYILAKRRLALPLDLFDESGLEYLSKDPTCDPLHPAILAILQEDKHKLKECLEALNPANREKLRLHVAWDYARRCPQLADIVVEYSSLLRPIHPPEWI